MNKLRELQKLTSEAVKNGHHGLFTTHDLALMLQVIPDTSFRKYLYTSVKTGVLRKVATNIYFNARSGYPKYFPIMYFPKCFPRVSVGMP